MIRHPLTEIRVLKRRCSERPKMRFSAVRRGTEGENKRARQSERDVREGERESVRTARVEERRKNERGVV